ncbi:unnamed protein product, partial [marine sediment metagenome]
EGRPIRGRDILIKAHEIAMPLRDEAARLREKKIVPDIIGEGLEETEMVSEIDLDRYIEQARKKLGRDATPQAIKAEVLRMIGG